MQAVKVHQEKKESAESGENATNSLVNQLEKVKGKNVEWVQWNRDVEFYCFSFIIKSFHESPSILKYNGRGRLVIAWIWETCGLMVGSVGGVPMHLFCLPLNWIYWFDWPLGIFWIIFDSVFKDFLTFLHLYKHSPRRNDVKSPMQLS